MLRKVDKIQNDEINLLEEKIDSRKKLFLLQVIGEKIMAKI